MSEASSPAVALICGAVLVTYFDGRHQKHTAFAHVLAVGPEDPETGRPTLTVAFPDPDATPQKLASVKWYEGYKRVPGVQHVSHPDVESGKESIAWGGTIGTLSDFAGEGPNIPQPEGDGSRPYLKRQEPVEPSGVSTAQAAAAQAGKTPASSTQSPLVNESNQSMIENPVNGSPAPAGDANPSGATIGATGNAVPAEVATQEAAEQTPSDSPTTS